MSKAAKVTLDLAYFLDSLLLETNLDKREFFNRISKTINTKFDNLYELTQFLSNCVDNLAQRIDVFTDNFGVKNGIPFPEPDTFGKGCIRFISLLNYAVKELYPTAFSNIQHDVNSNLALIYFQGKLAIAYKDKKVDRLLKTKNPVYVDFINGEVGYRVNGEVKAEACVKATLHKHNLNQKLNILDATAGFGQDAILFANAGANVLMVERNPIIGLLLADGLERLKQHKILNSTIGLRFPVSITNSKFNRSLNNQYFDTVYLDPMYPIEKGSAKTNKNMQLIQEIVGKDEDQDLLLDAVKSINCMRVVVKRPKLAPYLNSIETKDCLETKSHRFDYYIFLPNKSQGYVNFNEYATDVDLIAKFKLKDNQQLLSITSPTYEDLLKVRENLHHNNLEMEGLYGESGNFHSGSICFSECLQRETICAREISYKIYEFSKEIYAKEGFGKGLPGDYNYRRNSYQYQHILVPADQSNTAVKVTLPAEPKVLSKLNKKSSSTKTTKKVVNTKSTKTNESKVNTSKSKVTKTKDTKISTTKVKSTKSTKSTTTNKSSIKSKATNKTVNKATVNKATKSTTKKS